MLKNISFVIADDKSCFCSFNSSFILNFLVSMYFILSWPFAPPFQLILAYSTYCQLSQELVSGDLKLFHTCPRLFQLTMANRTFFPDNLSLSQLFPAHKSFFSAHLNLFHTLLSFFQLILVNHAFSKLSLAYSRYFQLSCACLS